MEANRRQYSEEFKKEAVAYSFSSEKPVVYVNLKLHHSIN